MNIVQVSIGETKLPTKIGGGVEAYVFSISKQLTAMGHTVILLDRKYSNDDPDMEFVDGVVIKRLRAKHFDFRKFPNIYNLRSILTYIFSEFSFANEARKYLKKNNDIEVIHVHEVLNGFLIALMLKSSRGKIFYTSHSSRRTKEFPTFRDKVSLLPEKWLARWSRKIIVLNEVTRVKLTQAAKINPEKVLLVPHQIDTSAFNPTLDTSVVKQKYGLTDKAVILFVGRICVDKGVEYLVKAANIIVNEVGYRDVLFLLVGPTDKCDIPYSERVESLIRESNLQSNVKLTGPVSFDDLCRLYAACDIFVLPSLADNSPRVITEAMASGKPTIVANAGGAPREVKDGESGFLVEPANEKQLANKIKYLIDNPNKAMAMGSYGSSLVERELNRGSMVEKLVQIYRDKL